MSYSHLGSPQHPHFLVCGASLMGGVAAAWQALNVESFAFDVCILRGFEVCRFHRLNRSKWLTSV